jgi:hemerythrin
MDQRLYIIWNESAVLGLPILDEQHRSIVAAINTLDYYIKKGVGKKAVEATLRILEQYSKLHFETEEDLMREAGYPGHEAHAELHRILARKTKTLLVLSNVEKDPYAVLKFLKIWWLDHVQTEDKQYVPYVKKL